MASWCSSWLATMSSSKWVLRTKNRPEPWAAACSFWRSASDSWKARTTGSMVVLSCLSSSLMEAFVEDGPAVLESRKSATVLGDGDQAEVVLARPPGQAGQEGPALRVLHQLPGLVEDQHARLALATHLVPDEAGDQVDAEGLRAPASRPWMLKTTKRLSSDTFVGAENRPASEPST